MGRLRFLFVATLVGFCFAAHAQQTYDLIITGARIVDGTGAPWFRADVAIQGDTIAAIGTLTGAPAKARIDAKGLVLAPGFIDIHSHSIRGITLTPSGENLIRQGVTTVLEGPDGGSPLPIGPALERIAALKPGINFGLMVGHGTVRGRVMGSENRKATPDEIRKMKDLVRQAMLDGAFGLSTGLFYVPGNYAPAEEVIELAKIAGEFGGFHTSHMRDEAFGVLDSVKETIRIGEEGGLPTQVTHHKIVGTANWGRSVETLQLVEEARRRGVDATIDQYPYTASSTGTGALFPQWSQAGGPAALKERLNTTETRAKIKGEIVFAILNTRGGGDPKNVVLASCGWDPKLAGKSLADLCKAKGLEATAENAAEVAIELQTAGGCSAIFHAINEEDIARIMKYPHTMVASDGGIPQFGESAPHPRSYGTFARVLGRYVREKKVLTLEDAVRKMSGLPAQRMGAWDRGIVRPGMKADLVVFDEATIIDKATFEQPHQFAEGVRHVLVNGVWTLRDGKMTTERGGRVLFGPARRGK